MKDVRRKRIDKLNMEIQEIENQMILRCHTSTKCCKERIKSI